MNPIWIYVIICYVVGIILSGTVWSYDGDENSFIAASVLISPILFPFLVVWMIIYLLFSIGKWMRR